MVKLSTIHRELRTMRQHYNYPTQITQADADRLKTRAQSTYQRMRNELIQNDHPIMRYEIGKLMMEDAEAQLEAISNEASLVQA